MFRLGDSCFPYQCNNTLYINFKIFELRTKKLTFFVEMWIRITPQNCNPVFAHRFENVVTLHTGKIKK
jgi:hypothetical protein